MVTMRHKKDYWHAGCMSMDCRNTDSAHANERGLSFCIRDGVSPASEAELWAHMYTQYTGIGRERMHFMANTRDLCAKIVGSNGLISI